MTLVCPRCLEEFPEESELPSSRLIELLRRLKGEEPMPIPVCPHCKVRLETF